MRRILAGGIPPLNTQWQLHAFKFAAMKRFEGTKWNNAYIDPHGSVTAATFQFPELWLLSSLPASENAVTYTKPTRAN
jgi:hypothetical protein